MVIAKLLDMFYIMQLIDEHMDNNYAQGDSNKEISREIWKGIQS
jgi:hypothetical protein